MFPTQKKNDLVCHLVLYIYNIEGKKWVHELDSAPVDKSTVTVSFLLSIQDRSQVTYYANFLHPFQKAIWAAFVLYCKPSSACHLKPNPLGEILALFNLQQTGFQSLYLDSKETLACGAFSFVKLIDLLVCKTAVSGDTGPSSNGFFFCWLLQNAEESTSHVLLLFLD